MVTRVVEKIVSSTSGRHRRAMQRGAEDEARASYEPRIDGISQLCRSSSRPLDVRPRQPNERSSRQTWHQMATEINVRLGKAESYDGRAELALQKADDHRLAAALQLAEARAVADDHRIGWKLWVDKNIERSYRDVKRLVAIGSAKDPVLALEGARKRDRDAKARSRDQGGGVIGDRAPGHPTWPATGHPGQGAPPSTIARSRISRRGSTGCRPRTSKRWSPTSSATSSTDAQQRKLAKGLAGMVRK